MAPVKDLPAALVDPWPLARLRAATSVVPIRFYEASAIEVARGLLGCVLVHGSTAGMIVETEAYLGGDDLAAHTARGLTERTKVIFGPPGRAYVYFIYGMHECLNVVAEPPGSPGCVLIRAVAPLAGLSVMAERRHWTGALRGLTSGPGKLTQALGITRSQYGHRLDRGESDHPPLEDDARVRDRGHAPCRHLRMRRLAAPLCLEGQPVCEPPVRSVMAADEPRLAFGRLGEGKQPVGQTGEG